MIVNLSRKSITNYYNKMQVETSSEKKQLVLLHEKIATQIDRALNNDTQFAQKRLKLNKAQNILSQLQIALKTDDMLDTIPETDEEIDPEDGLINSLFHLYEYLYSKLESQNSEDWSDGLEIAQSLCETFRELLNRK